MKIVYVTHAHANMGGMDKVLAVKANWLVKHGYEISIITNSKKETEPFFFFDPQISIFYMQAPQKKKEKEYIEELNHLLNSIKPDIAISTGMRNARYLCETDYPCKKIIESHFSKYQMRYHLAYFDKFAWGNYLANFFVKLKDSIVSKYDRLILLTHEDKLSYAYLKNVQVIPNPLFTYPDQTSNCINKSAIAVGRLVSQKGYDYMIDIWKEVAKVYPDWVLNIYGEGKKENLLRKKIKQYQLQEKIIIYPYTKNVYNLSQDSSIFLFTSRYEGQGMSLMEAMASGLASVSFECKCGPKDLIVNQHNGHLIPFGDKLSFVRQILKLIDDQEERQRIGENTIESMKDYSIDKIMKKWEDLFQELLA